MQNSKNELKRLEGIKNDEVLVGPRSVSIGITRICNITCKYCLGQPFDHLDSKNVVDRPPYIDMAIFYRLVDDCSELGVESMTLCGGEPTLHPQIKDMIAYVRGKDMQVSINTNATFKEELVKELGQVAALNIDLATLKMEDYQSIQGGTKHQFNRVLANISAVAEFKKANKGPELKIVYVLNKDNFDQIDEMIKWAVKTGINSIYFKIMRFNENIKDLAILEPDVVRLKNSLQLALKNGLYKHIKTNLKELARFVLDVKFNKECETINFYDLFEGDLYFHASFKEGFKCYYGWYSADIGPWGHVILCCTNRMTFVGNIYEYSFKEIWNSAYARQIRLTMKNQFDINKNFFKPCHYCPNVHFNTTIDAATQHG
ncbi:MAG: radical SAM protein [Candidatus Omnitrophica bacterium]|nr:radical SAM protein [Candidatus Omnitrophota bacterium]